MQALQNTVQKKTKQFFDNTFENVEKNVTNQVKQTASSVTSQFGLAQPQSSSSDAGTNEQGGQQNHNAGKPYDAATAEVVEDFYAPSDPNIMSAFANQILPKAGEMTPEDKAKYQKLSNQLHYEVYLKDLLERKSAEQEHQEEEQEEVQEKQMEELQMDEKKKKDDDIALRMQTNKAEQFPGVAG